MVHFDPNPGVEIPLFFHQSKRHDPETFTTFLRVPLPNRNDSSYCLLSNNKYFYSIGLDDTHRIVETIPNGTLLRNFAKTLFNFTRNRVLIK